jgi:hypothetical protein
MKTPTPQNLYPISDDEIKEGDLYLTDAGVFKCSGCESKRELSNFKKVKDSWNREEVIELLYKHTEMMLKGYSSSLNKWIEENL